MSDDGWLDHTEPASGDGFVQFSFMDERLETPWLRPQEAAAYLRVSLRKLETLREDTPTGVGQPWRKLGRTVRWHRMEMDRWVDAMSRTRGRRNGK